MGDRLQHGEPCGGGASTLDSAGIDADMAISWRQPTLVRLVQGHATTDLGEGESDVARWTQRQRVAKAVD